MKKKTTILIIIALLSCSIVFAKGGRLAKKLKLENRLLKQQVMKLQRQLAGQGHIKVGIKFKKAAVIIKKLQTQNAELQKCYDQAIYAKQQLAGKVQKLEKSLAYSNVQYQQICGVVGKLKQENAQFGSKYSAVCKERDSLKIQYGSVCKEIKQLKGKYSVAYQERNFFKTKLSGASASLHKLKGQYSAVCKERDSFKGKYSSIEDQYSQVCAERDSFKNKYSSIASQYSQVCAKISSLESQYKIACQERDTFARKYSSTQGQYTQACSARDSLKGQFSDACAKISKLEAELQQACAQVSELNEQNAALKARCEVSSSVKTFQLQFTGFHPSKMKKIATAINSHSSWKVTGTQFNRLTGCLEVKISSSKNGNARNIFKSAKRALRRAGFQVKLQSLNGGVISITPKALLKVGIGASW